MPFDLEKFGQQCGFNFERGIAKIVEILNILRESAQTVLRIPENFKGFKIVSTYHEVVGHGTERKSRNQLRLVVEQT